MAELEGMGPISYLMVEFDTQNVTGEGFQELVKLVDQGLIRILDLTFVAKGTDGTITALELADLDGDGQVDLSVFEGASSGLIGEDDLADAQSVIEPGRSAGIVIFENCWALPFVRSLRERGAQLIAAGYIPQDAIVASLDAAEAQG